MEESNLKDLLEELARRGFSDKELEQDIRKFESFQLPQFSLYRAKQFDEDRMHYRLVFHLNDENNQFELMAIEARHRLPVDIDHVNYQGADSIDLDKQMTVIDWKTYWEKSILGAVLTDSFKDVAQILDGLSRLLCSGSTEIVLAAEELMYKHFPREVFAVFANDPDRFQRVYEHSFIYSLDIYPRITAELAYLLITERADSLESQLDELLSGQVDDSDIRNEIYNKMGSIPQEAVLDFNWVTKDGSIVELSVPVTKKDNWYGIDVYQISVRQLPEIPEGVFNNVDATALDQKMGKIDWKDNVDLVIIKNDEDAGFDQDVEQLQEELFRMALDPDGKKAADLLMLKHYLHVPFFEDLISQSALDLFNYLPKSQAQFLVNVALDNAVNLVAGRPVMVRDIEYSGHTTWKRMGFTADGNNGALVGILGISEPEFEKMIAMLPVHMNDAPDISKGLKNGDLVKVNAKNGEPITVVVSESADRIKILDRNGREIPFNFKLDPDWTPKEERIANTQKEIKKQIKGQGKKTTGNKKKSL